MMMVRFRHKREAVLVATPHGNVKVEGDPDLLNKIERCAGGCCKPAFPEPQDAGNKAEKIDIWVGKPIELTSTEKPSLTITGAPKALQEIYLRIIRMRAEGSEEIRMDYRNVRLFFANRDELCVAIAGKPISR